METNLVMTEDEALELLSFLVTAARTQLDEAREYGPLRLLTAAQRLAEAIAPRVSAPTRALIDGPLGRLSPTAAMREDRAQYAASLDELCAAVGHYLVAHFAPGRASCGVAEPVAGERR